jgi:Uma2 family endonuclease
MAFVLSDAFLPATLTAHPMTDDEFAEFCAEHPDLFFEMTAEGEIIVIPPTYSLTGARNFELAGQLRVWARKDGRGVGCDSSTGFVLPNGARRSPDAAWILKRRVDQLDAASRAKYWHLCPDFVSRTAFLHRPAAARQEQDEGMAGERHSIGLAH